MSVPDLNHLPEILPLALNQFTASYVLKVVKTKEEMINVIDDAAKYPGNSLHDHDYHAWSVDKKDTVCNCSYATVSMHVEHPILDLIHDHSLRSL